MPSENRKHQHTPEEEREIREAASIKRSKRLFLRVIRPLRIRIRMIMRRWSARRSVMDERRQSSTALQR